MALDSLKEFPWKELSHKEKMEVLTYPISKNFADSIIGTIDEVTHEEFVRLINRFPSAEKFCEKLLNDGALV